MCPRGSRRGDEPEQFRSIFEVEDGFFEATTLLRVIPHVCRSFPLNDPTDANGGTAANSAVQPECCRFKFRSVDLARISIREWTARQHL